VSLIRDRGEVCLIQPLHVIIQDWNDHQRYN
jgi:hypothetical protein